jgi:hypothetical protein
MPSQEASLGNVSRGVHPSGLPWRRGLFELDDKTSGAVIAPNTSKPGIGSMIANQKAKIDEISSAVTAGYQPEVADGKLSPKAVSVLAETLLRVPSVKDDGLRVDRKRTPTPESLYLWAVANASIVFPYVSLESAVKNMKDTLYTPRSWGYIDGVYHLPKWESSDSPAWGLLREVILAKHKDEFVKFDADMTESVPELTATACAKDPRLDSVLIRILELVRNPLSATIRRTDLERSETNVRNAVDFVLLEKIYQEDEIYKNLTLSGSATSAGRRSRRVESKGEGNKITYTNVYLGYKLAEILGSYIPVKSAKSLESETFVHLLISFLRSLVPDAEDRKTFELPKPFFETPSNQLRSLIREGPRIKTKKGEKHNLYVPLSFVKASECTSYPEVARKEIIDLGSSILRTLDEVNKLPIERANKFIPLLRDYLAFSYALSDKCRKEWRGRAYIPNVSVLKKLLLGVPSLSELDDDANYRVSPSFFEQALDQMKSKGDSLPFIPSISDNDERAKLVAAISESVIKKKAKRS